MSDLTSVHRFQEESPFHPYRKPETTQDLEILASLGRFVLGLSEDSALDDAKSFAIWAREGAAGANDGQSAILSSLRRSVGIPAPAGTRNEQTKVWPVLPLVPTTQRVSCFTRLSSGAWNPGAFVAGMLHKGASSNTAADQLLEQVAHAFSIEEKDDAWARLLDSELRQVEQHWREGARGSKIPSVSMVPHSIDTPVFPSRGLVEDLPVILSLKSGLTRRQWISILDSFLRIACVTEMLWIARTSRELGRAILAISEGRTPPPDAGEIPELLVGDGVFLTSCQPFDAQVQQQIRDYAHERLFLSEYLVRMEAADPEFIQQFEKAGALRTNKGISLLLSDATKRTDQARDARSEVVKLIDAKPDFLRLNKTSGWPTQVYFFIKGALAQRMTREPEKRHFDQGYWSAKSGTAKSAKWIFRVGPIGVLTMAHLARVRSGGAATANSLVNQFARYGIRISLDEVTRGQVGTDLRHLGLVVDSPDAEGGMLIRTPFTTSS